jgi:hypothetical protein
MLPAQQCNHFHAACVPEWDVLFSATLVGKTGPNAEELKAACTKFLNSCSLSGQFRGMFQQPEFSRRLNMKDA